MVARKQRDRGLSGGLRDQGPKVLCGAMPSVTQLPLTRFHFLGYHHLPIVPIS